MRLFGRGSAKDSDGPVADEWQMSTGENDGQPLLARFNAGPRALAGSSRYPIQIGVAVPLRVPNAEGMPGPDEMRQLDAFEDAVIARAGTRAILVGVITTGGMREWVLYTGSGEWIPAFHEDLKTALPTHQVQVMAQTDPKWSVYRQFVPK